MNNRIYFTILFWIITWLSYSQQQIWLDENLQDWEAVPNNNTDPNNDQGNNEIDFIGLSASSDEEFLYLSLKLNSEIDLQENNELTLYIDTDNDESTGYSIDGIGADVRYFFGDREGYLYLNGQQKNIWHSDLGIVSIPTVTSDFFEICIRRTGTWNANGFQMENDIRFFFKDERNAGDRIPDMESFNYSLANTTQELKQFSFMKSDDHLRVMSFNVLQDGLFDFQQKESIKRIIKASEPDIIGFQEIYDHDENQVKAIIEDLFPNQDWYAAKRNPDIITISKYPITKTFATDGNGFFFIEHPQRDILICNAHLPCCDNDTDRQYEVDKLMAFIRESKDANSTIPLENNNPIIILGDMNLVGLKRQQTTLITGDIKNVNQFGGDFDPDWDGTPFADALPHSTGFPGAVTWSNPYSSFGPGRLDYIIYSDSQLDLKNSFAVNTARMTNSELNQLELLLSDSNDASDHFAVVADFKFKPTVSTSEKELNNKEVYVWPNPSSDLLNVKIKDSKGLNLRMHLIKTNGKYVRLLENTSIDTEDFQSNYSLSKYPSGHYLVKIEIEDVVFFRKLVLK